ncbi:AT hook motif domain containing protein, partial [Acanthamoeba castellanii str. Neff]
MASDCTNKACRLCRLSHTACDGRCVALGKPELCQDVEPKKRGRPPKHFPASTEGGWRMSKKQKTEVPPLPSTTAVSNPPSPDSSPTHSPRSSCADLGIHTTKQREGDALLKALL